MGRRVSAELLARGHRVRVLTHRSRNGVPGAEVVAGNVVSGEGLTEAVDGVDTVVHAAPGRGGIGSRSEAAGTSTVLAASEAIGAHFVYVSKVGVDRNRSPYHDAKWVAEGVVEALGSRWSIQRVTHFHDLVEALLGAPVFFKTPELAFQPVDVADVARRLADVVEAGPSGRLPDFGGPELLGIETLARRRRRITGRHSLLVRVPRVGLFRDYADGSHLAPEHRDGTVTWSDWLRTQNNGRH